MIKQYDILNIIKNCKLLFVNYFLLLLLPINESIGVRTGVVGYGIAIPVGCKHPQFLFFLTNNR